MRRTAAIPVMAAPARPNSVVTRPPHRKEFTRASTNSVAPHCDKPNSSLLCCSRLQIADEEPGRVLPCLIRVAAKTEHAAEDALAGRDVDNAEIKAADQCTNF